jgi:two-component system chemotaxis sensor kinase CheA
LDLSKYRAVFLEDATEHLADMSRALLELEKEPGRVDSIDLLFRLAHSIKGMAASLDYREVTACAHALEDRMQAIRSRGRVEPGAELSTLFEGLGELESLVRRVREAGEAAPPRPEPRKKKLLSPP